MDIIKDIPRSEVSQAEKDKLKDNMRGWCWRSGDQSPWWCTMPLLLRPKKYDHLHLRKEGGLICFTWLIVWGSHGGRGARQLVPFSPVRKQRPAKVALLCLLPRSSLSPRLCAGDTRILPSSHPWGHPYGCLLEYSKSSQCGSED